MKKTKTAPAILLPESSSEGLSESLLELPQSATTSLVKPAKGKTHVVDFLNDQMPDRMRDLIETSLAIENEDARAAGTIGYMARALTSATMPHRQPKTPYFERVNGNFTLTMMSRPKVGLPYGTIPRLLVAWVCTEAVRVKSRELILGHSLNEFMGKLDLNRSGGLRGDITRLRDQTKRLFSCIISAEFEGKDSRGKDTWQLQNIMIAEKAMLFWEAQDEHEAGQWDSKVILSEPFYRECVEHPIPVDMRAFMGLKRSPMAIDIYIWLTYRFSYLKRRTVIPWEIVKGMFGSDYADTPQGLRDFRRAFTRELVRVIALYRHAGAVPLPAGLQLTPSLTSVPRVSVEQRNFGF